MLPELIMQRLYFLFFLIPWCLFASDVFQMAVGMGYRRDDAGMKFSTSSEELYTEKNLINGVELDLSFRFSVQKVRIALEGDVGWFVSGSSRNNPLLQVPTFTDYEGRFSQSVGGFFSDGMANLGYAFSLDSIQFVPQAGFGVFYQQIKHGNNHPQFDRTDGVAALSYTLAQTRLKRLWFGPCLGADLLYRPHPAWLLAVGYFYYFAHFNQKFDPFANLTYETPTASEFFISQKFRTSVPAHGQRITGKISAQIAQEWRMNLLFNAFLFSERNKKVTSKQVIQQVFPTESFTTITQKLSSKAWWEAYATVLEIEYFF